MDIRDLVVAIPDGNGGATLSRFSELPATDQLQLLFEQLADSDIVGAVDGQTLLRVAGKWANSAAVQVDLGAVGYTEGAQLVGDGQKLIARLAGSNLSGDAAPDASIGIVRDIYAQTNAGGQIVALWGPKRSGSGWNDENGDPLVFSATGNTFDAPIVFTEPAEQEIQNPAGVKLLKLNVIGSPDDTNFIGFAVTVGKNDQDASQLTNSLILAPNVADPASSNANIFLRSFGQGMAEHVPLDNQRYAFATGENRSKLMVSSSVPQTTNDVVTDTGVNVPWDVTAARSTFAGWNYNATERWWECTKRDWYSITADVPYRVSPGNIGGYAQLVLQAGTQADVQSGPPAAIDFSGPHLNYGIVPKLDVADPETVGSIHITRRRMFEVGDVVRCVMLTQNGANEVRLRDGGSLEIRVA